MPNLLRTVCAHDALQGAAKKTGVALRLTSRQPALCLAPFDCRDSWARDALAFGFRVRAGLCAGLREGPRLGGASCRRRRNKKSCSSLVDSTTTSLVLLTAPYSVILLISSCGETPSPNDAKHSNISALGTPFHNSLNPGTIPLPAREEDP